MTAGRRDAGQGRLAKQFNLTLTQSLLASVTLLESEYGLPPVDARRTASAAFGASGTWLARGAIQLWLRLERDPFEGVVRRGPSIVSKAMWGDGMTVENRQRAARFRCAF